jgi:hypothetical protein
LQEAIMVTVTVVRHIPTPIVGIIGLVPDHDSASFEEALDWLETTGVLVERVDPATQAPSEMGVAVPASTPLPVVFVNGRIVSEGRFLTLHELAHLVAQATTALPDGLVRAVASVGAAAAVGDADAIATAVREARASGLADEAINTALRTGADRRADHHTAPAA